MTDKNWSFDKDDYKIIEDVENTNQFLEIAAGKGGGKHIFKVMMPDETERFYLYTRSYMSCNSVWRRIRSYNFFAYNEDGIGFIEDKF